MIIAHTRLKCDKFCNYCYQCEPCDVVVRINCVWLFFNINVRAFTFDGFIRGTCFCLGYFFIRKA